MSASHGRHNAVKNNVVRFRTSRDRLHSQNSDDLLSVLVPVIQAPHPDGVLRTLNGIPSWTHHPGKFTVVWAWPGATVNVRIEREANLLFVCHLKLGCPPRITHWIRGWEVEFFDALSSGGSG